jgi:hypothetical protein
MASAATCLTWEASSIGVRWRPSLAMAIVTRLVTRSVDTLDRSRQSRTISLGMSAAGSGTSTAAARRHLGLSVSARRVPWLPGRSGTYRARVDHGWTAPASMVGAWHAEAVVLIAVGLAQPAPRTKSMIGARVSLGPRYEWASAGSLTCCTCASLIWPSCDGYFPKMECGLSSSKRVAQRPKTQVHSTTELLLRRTLRGPLQPAYTEVTSQLDAS